MGVDQCEGDAGIDFSFSEFITFLMPVSIYQSFPVAFPFSDVMALLCLHFSLVFLGFLFLQKQSFGISWVIANEVDNYFAFTFQSTPGKSLNWPGDHSGTLSGDWRVRRRFLFNYISNLHIDRLNIISSREGLAWKILVSPTSFPSWKLENYS